MEPDAAPHGEPDPGTTGEIPVITGEVVTARFAVLTDGELETIDHARRHLVPGTAVSPWDYHNRAVATLNDLRAGPMVHPRIFDTMALPVLSALPPGG